MKKIITSIIILILTCMIFSANTENMEDRDEYYPLLVIVVEKDYWSDGVSVLSAIDHNGNKWCFFDEDDTWSIGDIANLLMWNAGGAIDEDEIVKVYWIGYTEYIETFIQIMGWEL